MEEAKKDFKIFNKFKNPINIFSSFKTKRNSAPMLFENNFLNVKDLSVHQKINPKEKHYLILKKINLRDKANKYYNKAVKKIFSDVDKYLDHTYEGKKVIVGKECTSGGLKELRDYFCRRNRRKRTVRKNDLKSSFYLSSRTMKVKGSHSHLFAEAKRNTSSDTLKNMHLLAGKEYITKYPLSDNELRKIFQDSAEREKKNKNDAIDLSSSSEVYQKIDNNKIKSIRNLKNNAERMNINNMLNLQEKILKDRIKKIKMNKIITNKIMSATLKENSKLLMNNKKDLLVIKSKDQVNNPFDTFIKEDKVLKNWLSELRINSSKKKKINEIKKEIIYYNKDINASIEINDNDKFKKSIFHKKINKNLLKTTRSSYLLKYKNDNAIKKDKNINKNENFYNSLYIKGKNLLEHEKKISKELIGKKKKIIHYSYPIEEISNVLLAKSNNLNTQKAIVNSIEIHNL